MKSLANLNVPKDESLQFPFGNIQNETPTQEGTPVVREIYGDILMNLYKIVQLAGIDFTGDEDSDDTQYQLVDGLRKFYNELNDSEKILQGSGTVWRVDLDLANLPNKFIFISRPDDDYNSNVVYKFKGIDNVLEYDVTSPTGFKAGDEVLTIIDTAGVRIYNLTDSSKLDISFPVLGSPISFNDTDSMYYYEDGRLYNEKPAVYKIQKSIQDDESNLDLLVLNVVIMKGKLFCLVFDTNIEKYDVYFFLLDNLTVPVKCDLTNFGSATGTDEIVYMYCDGESLYFTNNFNNSVDDYGIKKVVFENANQLTEVSFFQLANSFQKTTNAIFKANKLKTFVLSSLKEFNIDGSLVEVFDDFKLNLGRLFAFNGNIYYSTGDAGVKLSI